MAIPPVLHYEADFDHSLTFNDVDLCAPNVIQIPRATHLQQTVFGRMSQAETQLSISRWQP